MYYILIFLSPLFPFLLRIGGEARELDQIGPKIFTKRTNTTLNCAAGSMLVDVEFYEPFYGIIYPNGSRNSACKVQGHGKTKYHLDLPLKGCGTKRVSSGDFFSFCEFPLKCRPLGRFLNAPRKSKLLRKFSNNRKLLVDMAPWVLGPSPVCRV